MSDFYNLDMEKSILSSLMSIDNSYLEVSNILNPTDFVAGKHEIIYNVIASLSNTNMPYDVMMVLEQLKPLNVDLVEYEGYLTELLASSPATKFNLIAYAKQVRDLSALRHANQLLLNGRDLLAQQGDYADKINKIIEDLTVIVSEKTTMKGAETISQLLPDFIDSIRINAIDETTPFIKTGFTEIDNKVNIQAGELVIIAGRPAQGKTTLGQVILQNIVENTKGNAVFFSMEMPKTQVLQRFVASTGNIILPKVTSGQGFTAQDNDNLNRVEQKYSKDYNLFIDDRKLTIAQMRTELNKIRNKHGKITVILVDYLQIIAGLSNLKNAGERSTAIADMANSLKDFAKEYECPVIALAQFNRENTQGRPQMSYIAESGGIERIADHVWGIYHPPQKEDAPPDNTAEIIVLKQRQGAIGTIKLRFEGVYSRFIDDIPTN